MLSPAQLMERLEQIEADLAGRQNVAERAAEAWFVAKRDKEKARAETFVAAQGPMELRKAIAELASVDIGKTEEGKWHGTKAAIDVLEARAMIGMALLRAHGRAGQ
jgi:hypothetical protein